MGCASSSRATGAEAAIAASVASACPASAVSVAGRTSLGGLAAVLADARLVIANDTGAAHLSVAVGTPTVVVVTTSDGARWGPRDRRRHRLVQASGRADGLDPSLADVVAAGRDLLADFPIDAG